jgi:murein endopeptidase
MRHTGRNFIALTPLVMALFGCAAGIPAPGANVAGPSSASTTAATEARASHANDGAESAGMQAPPLDQPDVEMVQVAAPMADPAEMAAIADEALGDDDHTIHAHDEHDAVEDDLPDDALPPDATGTDQSASPLFALAPAEVNRRVRKDLASLGPMSIGFNGKGLLVNGVQMHDGPHHKLMQPSIGYGTQETIGYLTRAIDTVNHQFPDTPKMLIGHLSAKRGGKLRSHKSHQSGRDVDLSFYYKPNTKSRWYSRAHAGNLDVKRTWAFVRSLVTETDVMFIFINTSLQRLLKRHALAIGEDPEWLDNIFQYDSKSTWPIIRHSPGHDTHIHVRFYNPIAQEMGRRAYNALVAANRIKPPTYYSYYRAKKGDILGRVAKRFKVSIAAIQKANRIRGTTILAGKTYRIPRKGQARQPGKVRIPPRRLPPATSGSGRVASPADQ